MALLDYIIFIFGIYGIAWTITQSKLLSKPVSYLQEKSLFEEGFDNVLIAWGHDSCGICQFYESRDKMAATERRGYVN